MTTPRTIERRAALSLAGTALGLWLAGPAAAETPVFAVTVSEPVASAAPAASEPDVVVAAPPEGLDSKPVAAIGPNERTVERVRRAAAETFAPVAPVDVRASFDGIDAEPRLNVDTVRQASTAVRGVPLRFRGYWNYPAFVARAEVRIHERGEARTARPLAIVGIDRNGEGEWVVPTTDALPADLSYRLRVYDGQGRFDETEATALTIIDTAAEPPVGGVPGDDGLEAYGSDRTAVRNIPVRGGLVTVSGENVAAGEAIRVDGRPVPVDAEGRFVAETIVPHGVSTVAVELDGPRARVIERDVEVPETDVFYVALGEVTVGQGIRSGDALRRANGDDPERVELTGRGAVYLKGRVKGDVLITAMADTGEHDSLDDMFKGVHGRGAKGLLQRLDPDRFYPVYGDDSDLSDGAPTRNGLFVRVERDDSFVQYGSYSVAFEEAELARLDRGVHGAVAQHRSVATTSFGERKREVTAFAAHNETVPALESFLGTGGTLFRLGRQDIVIGTERLVVEVRDRTSGLVKSALVLEPGRDYRLDPVSGRVRLAKPLRARVNDGSTVRQGALPGDDVYLVARYEYRPSVEEMEGYNAGARAQAWLGEKVRVGATAQSEETAGERRQLLGADVVLRHSEGTYLKGEVARSEGPGYGARTSLDGGLSFEGGQAQSDGRPAHAYRLEGAVDLKTALRGAAEGRAGAYLEHFEQGFTGQRHDVLEDTTRFGAEVTLENGRAALGARVDGLVTEGDASRVTAGADVSYEVRDGLTVTLGATHDDVRGKLATGANALRGGLAGVLGTTLREGSRTDVALEVAYDSGEDWKVRAYGQTTAYRTGERERNDRVGLGGELRLNDRMVVGADVSYGDDGVGGSAEITYEGDDDVSVTLGYGYAGDLSAVESRFSRGYAHNLTARTTKRYSDYVSVYSEGQLGFTRYSDGRDLSQSYGIELTPTEAWAMSALVERGTLFDTAEGEYSRTGGSATVAYRGDAVRASLTGDARRDDGLGRDALVYGAKGTVSYAPSDSWTIHGTGEWVEASGRQTATLGSDYLKLVAAGAYRPVEHDRVNALVKYLYLSDLSPTGQTLGGAGGQPKQRSHVVSADAIVDVAPWLSVGGKVALRHGEVSLDRDSDVFLSQTASLGILRADLHVTDNWDIMLEGRALAVQDVDMLLGGVIGVWRQVGKVKVGGGYSFSSFSDDITDLTHDDHGWFLNVAAAL